MATDPVSQDHAAERERLAQDFARSRGAKRVMFSGLIGLIVLIVLAFRGSPLLNTLVGCGFVVVFTIERVVYVTLISRQKKELADPREFLRDKQPD